MDVSGDELAGVVDLFGALTRAELGQGLVELAFKRGEEIDADAFADDVDAALRSYHLVAVEEADHDLAVSSAVLLAGPVAFPELPEGAADLPHIMDVSERDVDRTTAATAAAAAFRADAATAVDSDDRERVTALLDVSYELEAWGPVDLADARERLDDALG